MKRYAGLAIFVVMLSAPAYAQSKTASAGSSGGSANAYSGGGGGGGGLGGSSSSRLPSYPPAQFGVAAVSGTDASFVPSAFLAYDQAIAAGKAAQVDQRSLAEIAAENNSTQKSKSKVSFVQDANGNVVSVPR